MSFISWLISENESQTTCQSWQLCRCKEPASRMLLLPQPPSLGPAPSGGSSSPNTAAPAHTQPHPSTGNHGQGRGYAHMISAPQNSVRRQKAPRASQGWPHRKLQWGGHWRERSIELRKHLSELWGLFLRGLLSTKQPYNLNEQLFR